MFFVHSHLLAVGGPIGAFAATLAAALAVLAVGGSVALRWQRARQQFELAKLALEHGGNGRLAMGPPLWLVSLRQGVTTVALAAGLLAVGGAGWATGARVPFPNDPRPAVAGATTRPADDAVPAVADDSREPQARPEPAEPRDGPQDWHRHLGRDGRPTPEDDAGRPFPPRPSRDREMWNEARAQIALSKLSVAAGTVLALLGAARIAFSRAERLHDEQVAGFEGPGAAGGMPS